MEESAINSLLTLAERLLRVFVLLLAVSNADKAMIDNVRIMQGVVNSLESPSQVSECRCLG